MDEFSPRENIACSLSQMTAPIKDATTEPGKRCCSLQSGYDTSRCGEHPSIQTAGLATHRAALRLLLVISVPSGPS